EWEERYAESERRFELHTAQIERNRAAAAEAASSEKGGADVPSNYTSEAPAAEGSLASDEQLAALREKLAGN
ncbi:30S ribosomal protein S1, partial [Alloscardovia omnicolens]|nr:30S ribosomal protein S1 [Alloscardovia omnicolens]